MVVVTINRSTHSSSKTYAKGNTVLNTNGVSYTLGTTTGATFTGAFATGWGVNQWHLSGANRGPKVTRYTAGSYTFTPERSAIRTEVEMCGAGGGNSP